MATRKGRGSKLHDFGRILDSDWDNKYDGRRNPPLEEANTHISVFQRYVEGRDWSDTPAFSAKLQAIRDGRVMDECRSKSELVERYERLDDVYDDIRRNGWRLSEEVGGRFQDNLSVSITRIGGLLLGSGGAHRLAIAKLLRLPSVPVYVLSRHSGWQAVREAVSRGSADLVHPDLADIQSAD